MSASVQFTNTYSGLPDRFFARVPPTRVGTPRLIELNAVLADHLGLDPRWLASAEGIEMLAGNTLPATADPIATAYAGHQFGGFVPQLGDGRAILLGEVIDRAGRRQDIQLKGSGPTPFSRRGDGRSALGPVLREYIVSETMACLGIPTTRALAAVSTGEKVFRDTVLPGAVLTRVASSHIRVGTFQFFASREDTDGVRVLADYVLARHYPTAAADTRPYRALLDAVVGAQAELVAQWLLIGFIHGVMNTDNMSVAGETIDYGPCAFLDEYKPSAVFSYIDRGGRYAYENQPVIAQWNLTRLAECLLPLLAENSDHAIAEATEVLETFTPRFDTAFRRGLRRKLGLLAEQEGDTELGRDLLQAMSDNRADFTLTFRRLSDAVLGSEHDEPVRSLFADPAAFDAWVIRWRARLASEPGDLEARRLSMRAANPAYIPRNHLIEAVIRAGEDRDDFAPFRELLQVLSKPFEDQPEFAARYAQPPLEHERVLRTFCGT